MFIALCVYLVVTFVALALMAFELYESTSWRGYLRIKDIMPLLGSFIPVFNFVVVVIGINLIYEKHFADMVLWKKSK